jgi:hypothetical protein
VGEGVGSWYKGETAVSVCERGIGNGSCVGNGFSTPGGVISFVGGSTRGSGS